MPIQQKAQWARLKVGILALAAMVILATLIFLITGHVNIFICYENIDSVHPPLATASTAICSSVAPASLIR